MKLAALAILPLATFLWGSPAQAQDKPADIEVQGSDILRTCREIHRAPQVQDPSTVVTAYGTTFNCRLINASGSTLAQVSPEEVCERLTGSREWYRGAGTQVFCRADGKKTRTLPVPCPQPDDEQIFQDDVARACQKIHRTGNATAELLRITPNGPEFNCRLANSAGFTISGVSPEQVCEVKTGRRYWCHTETAAYCRGPDYVEPEKPAPGPAPAPGPQPAPAPAPEPGAPDPGADKPSTGQPSPSRKTTDATFCKPAASGAEAVVRIAGWREKEPGDTTLSMPLVTCETGKNARGVPPQELCPSITGSDNWYLSADGFNVVNGLLWPNFIAVCRGKGPRERIAYANIVRVCKDRGWPYGNNGILAGKEPQCFDKAFNFQPIAVDDVCRTLYGTSAWEVKGVTQWCLP